MRSRSEKLWALTVVLVQSARSLECCRDALVDLRVLAAAMRVSPRLLALGSRSWRRRLY